METNLDCTKAYNTSLRRLLRRSPLAVFPFSFFLAFYYAEAWGALLMFHAFLWMLLILPAFSCPRCGEIVGRVKVSPEKDGMELYNYTLLLSRDGRCQSCGASLKNRSAVPAK